MPVSWNRDESRKMMKCILQWRSKGNKGPNNWKHVASIYNSTDSTAEAVKGANQLKNHHAQCKAKYNAWMSLSGMTGLQLTEEGFPTEEELGSDRIKQFIQNYSTTGAGLYVLKNALVDMDLWHPVFVGKCATGEKSFSPALAESRSKVNIQKGKETKKPGEFLYDNEGSGDSDEDRVYPRVSLYSNSAAESKSSEKTISSKKRKIGSTSFYSPAMDDQLDKAYEMIKITEPVITQPTRLADAVRDMEYVKMRGLPFLIAALKFLKDNQYGEFFLDAKSEDERIEWLKLVGQ